MLAVDALDLDVRRGEIYGFLGPQRSRQDDHHPHARWVSSGRPAARSRCWAGACGRARATLFARVGYLVETATAYPNLTVRENLDIQRRLTGRRRAAVAEAIELLRLGELADRRAGVLSLGNKQRLSLARALLHRPELLVLDEPTNALDPAGIVEVRELLRSLADEHGVTVFVSSHILGEIAHLADRVGIMHEGRLLEELDRDRAPGGGAASSRSASPDRGAPRRCCAAGFGFASSVADGRRLRVFDARGRVAELARILVGAGLDLTELTPVHEDLEAHFLRLTGGARDVRASTRERSSSSCAAAR